MKMTIDTAVESGCRQFRSVESKTTNTYYYSAWLYVPANVTADQYWNIFQYKSNHCNIEEPFWVIDLMPRSSSRMYLRLRYKGGNEEVPGPHLGDPGGRTAYFGQTLRDVVPGQWTHIEFYLDQSSGLPISAGQSAYDGEVQVWQDGVELWHITQAMTRYPASWDGCSAAGDQRWSLNNYSDGLNPRIATLYWDDAVISTGQIGLTGGGKGK
jgi:hypothetical protein